MILHKIKCGQFIVVKPAFEKDCKLFLHCSGNYEMVQYKNFETNLKPILKAHGIHALIINKTNGIENEN